jgi:hypothetical protein
MYIWRGKNRRDRRQHALAGSADWGVPVGSQNHEAEDELIRYNGEIAHIEYFGQKTKYLMEKYLQTPHGRKEIQLLLDDVNKLDSRISNFVKLDEVKEENISKMKKNIRVLFGKFSVGKSNLITVPGLQALLSDLQMTMSKKQFDEYLKELPFEDTTDGLLLDFEDFYQSM